MKRSVPVLFGLLVLLAALPMSAAPKNRDCFLRRAEATICPSFHVFEDGATVSAVSGDGSTVVGSIAVDGGNRAVRWVNGVRSELAGFVPGLADASTHATAVSRDGSVVAGGFGVGVRYWPRGDFRWRNGVFEILPKYSLFDTVIDMSGDGSVLALFLE